MNCFEILKGVLDEAYAAIPGDESAKDAKIVGELTRLRSLYRDLREYRNIDYGNPLTRFAYVYAYVSCHANLVYQLVNEHKVLRDIFKAERVQLACIGGGPGSDLLGVLKFLELSGTELALTCNIFDREPAWGETYTELFEQVDSGVRLLQAFHNLDVTEEKGWRKLTKYLASDLFTMIYFMSEVFGVKDQAEPYFEHLFAKAKRGAMFLFVDNQKAGTSRAFSDWFDSLANGHGVKIVEQGEGRMLPPVDEEKRALGRYYEKFRDPRIVANVAWRIGRKA